MTRSTHDFEIFTFLSKKLHLPALIRYHNLLKDTSYFKKGLN